MKGVCRHGKGYAAYIRKNGRTINLGTRVTIEEAAALYWQKAQELHGEYARAA
jgi:hypothetical protein